jgi:hypothetical protein
MSIIEDLEIVFGQPFNRSALAVSHHDINVNQARGAADDWRLLGAALGASLNAMRNSQHVRCGKNSGGGKKKKAAENNFSSGVGLVWRFSRHGS